MKKFVYHKKTGKIYKIISDYSICTTNKYAGSVLVTYTDSSGLIFARDYTEFWIKFRYATFKELLKAIFKLEVSITDIF